MKCVNNHANTERVWTSVKNSRNLKPYSIFCQLASAVALIYSQRTAYVSRYVWAQHKRYANRCVRELKMRRAPVPCYIFVWNSSIENALPKYSGSFMCKTKLYSRQNNVYYIELNTDTVHTTRKVCSTSLVLGQGMGSGCAGYRITRYTHFSYVLYLSVPNLSKPCIYIKNQLIVIVLSIFGKAGQG